MYISIDIVKLLNTIQFRYNARMRRQFSGAIIKHFFTEKTVNAHILQTCVILLASFILLYLFDKIVELLTPRVARHADSITTDENVLRLRRAETFIGLGIIVVRVLVVLVALFIIWKLIHPSSGPVALIGIGTVAILLANATVVPLLRDVAYGFIMIAERWYNVGDHVAIEPFTNSGGIVEKVTLRSTKLRSVNGEAIWFNHQYIQGARVTSAASHLLAIETFVNDPEIGKAVIEKAIKIIPTGPITIPQPLLISEIKLVDD
jgi:small-conductance mechanosensitive channel